MDFSFTPEEDRFRAEVRQFLSKELPSDWNFLEDEFADDHTRWQFVIEFKKKLAVKGWLTLSWPKEFGGVGASHLTQTIYNEELAYARAPGRDIFGTRMLGPVLMLYGTTDQQKQFLPPIASGEIQWCQGYSEPNSGSDLASVQLQAVDSGDHFILNGSKMWTSRAHVSDAIFLLARTNPSAPKHKGLSFLLCDLASSGISIEPIPNLAGMHYFNQVRFDDVKVPKGNLIGAKDEGWSVATALLDFERSGIEYSAEAAKTLEELTAFAKTEKRNGMLLSQSESVRQSFASLYAQIEVSRLISYRIAWLQSTGAIPNKEASMGKLFGTELQQRIAVFGMQLLGLSGQLTSKSRWAPLEGLILKQYLLSFSTTIRGGTSEIQRNIIAQRGLGLPRK
jgi:alkylation response protein AidB-like acyl-CoA dehydrogenase